MHRYLLTLLTIFFLFSGTSCPEDCEYFDTGQATLEVTLENPAESYSVGQTIWLSAEFSSTIGDGNNLVEIGEGGGLVVSQLYRVLMDSSVISAGLTAFTPLENEGMILDNGPEDDPSAALLRYTCNGGECAFRKGFRIDSSELSY